MQRWVDILAGNSDFPAKRHRLQFKFTPTGSDLTLTLPNTPYHSQHSLTLPNTTTDQGLTSFRSGVPAWFGKSNRAWKMGGTLCFWGDPASVVGCVPSTARAGSQRIPGARDDPKPAAEDFGTGPLTLAPKPSLGGCFNLREPGRICEDTTVLIGNQRS